jgi:hypothetical protein
VIGRRGQSARRAAVAVCRSSFARSTRRPTLITRARRRWCRNAPATRTTALVHSNLGFLEFCCEISLVVLSVDCKVSEFGSWSPCSTSCGGGISVRSRYVMQHAINGGRLCPHLTEWQTCGDKPCPPQCKVSEWSEWSECSLPCGGGMQTATRTIQFSGYNCPPPSELVQTRPCGLDRCSVDCLVGEWEHSGPCTADCGTGYQKYTRSILRMPAFGGMPCPVLEYVVSEPRSPSTY